LRSLGARAFSRALNEPGEQPFLNEPPLIAQRLDSVHGGGTAVNTTGFSQTIRDTGDYR
jgi:hypothetical protein